MKWDLVMVALHVAANTVWVGSLLAASVVALATTGAPTERAELARKVFKGLAVPSFGLSIGLGAVRLAMDWHYFMGETHFMHAKLVLAFAAIVAHHVLGVRLRKLPTDSSKPPRLIALLALVFGVSCVGSVMLVVVRPF